jgi:hypothetical protein
LSIALTQEVAALRARVDEQSKRNDQLDSMYRVLLARVQKLEGTPRGLSFGRKAKGAVPKETAPC